MYWLYTILLTFICISGMVRAESSLIAPPTISTVQNNISTQKSLTPLKITVTTKAPYFTEKDDGFLDLLLVEIGNRSGIKFEVLKNIPPARALSKLNQGTTDGDFPRVSGLEEIYPSLIHIPEKIVDFQFVAFSYEECIYPISFDSIQESKVGLIIGWKIYEQQTKNFSHLTTIKKPPQLFNLLQRKRIQYALHEHYIGNKFITELALENEIHECAPALMIKPMYFYLHKKHQMLVPAISRALKEIKSDGTYQRIALATLPNKK